MKTKRNLITFFFFNKKEKSFFNCEFLLIHTNPRAHIHIHSHCQVVWVRVCVLVLFSFFIISVFLEENQKQWITFKWRRRSRTWEKKPLNYYRITSELNWMNGNEMKWKQIKSIVISKRFERYRCECVA